MNKAFSVLVLLAAPAIFAGCASAPPGPLANRGLPNFSQVDSQLYRGAQPSAEGVEELRARRIATMINLRQPGEDPEAMEAVENAARSAGLQYHSVPMSGWLAPTREDVELVLSLISDRTAQPVFVYCRRGADRTGTVVAIYRITQNGWTADEAMREARGLGMWRLEFGMRRFIRGWYAEVQRQGSIPAADPLRLAEGTRP
jgi:uncharacterized protein (TIGR01244 family)